RTRRHEIGGGVRGLLAWSAESAVRRARGDRARDRAVRTGSRARPRLWRGVVCTWRRLQPEGPVPRLLRSALQGHRSPPTRDYAEARSRRSVRLAGQLAALYRPGGRGDRRAQEGGGARSRRRRRASDAGARLLDVACAGARGDRGAAPVNRAQSRGGLLASAVVVSRGVERTPG